MAHTFLYEYMLHFEPEWEAFYMKRLISVSCGLVLVTIVANAQPLYFQEGKALSVAAGYSNVHMNVDNFQAAFVEATWYPSYSLGWEFSARVEIGQDFLSFEPIGLIGLPMWMYSSSHKMGRDSNLVGALLSIASAKCPIALGDYGMFEITPYWSLLKLTRLYDDKFRINGDVGVQLKLFPLAYLYWANTLYISGFIQSNWAYGKDKNYYGRYNVKDNRSDFYGYSWGFQIGYYF